MRPFYETADQRKTEDVVAALMAQEVGGEQVPFRTGSTVDRIVIKDGVAFAMLEIKTREIPWRKHPTYIVSEERMNLFRLIAARLNSPAILCVRWLDATGWIDVRATPFLRLESGGRTDRGDKRDIEPVLHYDVRAFKMLGKSAPARALTLVEEVPF